MAEERHKQRRRRRRALDGKLIWLIEQVTGDLADALDRDLRSDRLTFDELGWRGLWAYITAAPPGTAIHYHRSEGWQIGDKIAAENLYSLRDLTWHFKARNFQEGGKQPFPQRIPYPGMATTEHEEAAASWETVTIDELVSPEVRALLQGA